MSTICLFFIQLFYTGLQIKPTVCSPFAHLSLNAKNMNLLIYFRIAGLLCTLNSPVNTIESCRSTTNVVDGRMSNEGYINGYGRT